MNAKFSVGESVILQSPNLSEYNVEYTIHAILPVNEDFKCRLTARMIYTTEGLSYILDEPLADLHEIDGSETLWAPSSIRKKQEPSKFSYTQLMQSLRSPIYGVN